MEKTITFTAGDVLQKEWQGRPFSEMQNGAMTTDVPYPSISLWGESRTQAKKGSIYVLTGEEQQSTWGPKFKVKRIVSVDGKEVTTTTPSRGTGGFRGISPDDQKRIIRQSCLSSAANIVAAYLGSITTEAQSEQDMMKLTTQLAEVFESWVNRPIPSTDT